MNARAREMRIPARREGLEVLVEDLERALSMFVNEGFEEGHEPGLLPPVPLSAPERERLGDSADDGVERVEAARFMEREPRGDEADAVGDVFEVVQEALGLLAILVRHEGHFGGAGQSEVGEALRRRVEERAAPRRFTRAQGGATACGLGHARGVVEDA